MTLFLSLIGIFLSVILIYFNLNNYRSSIYLGFFFLGISVYGLIQYVLLDSGSVNQIRVFLACIPISGILIYLIGPMLYFYVRSILRDNSRLSKIDFLHFLPALIYFLLTIPDAVVFLNSDQEIAAAIAENRAAIKFYHASVLNELFPFSALFLSRPVLVIVYIFGSAGLWIHYTRTSKPDSVFKGQEFMFKWLLLLLGSLFILVLSHILLVIGLTIPGTHVLFTLQNLQIFSALGLTALLVSPFFFPTILYGLPRFPGTSPEYTNLTGNEYKINRSTEYESVIEEKKVVSHFESEYLHLIREKAELCMKEQQPYLDADCNLGYFAKLIHVPAHHLAYYFREEKKQSFNDYRNEWRIIHAKNLIQQGKANEMTLEAIGHLSGFTSRNSFFTAFKKVEGVPPGVIAAKYAT